MAWPQNHRPPEAAEQRVILRRLKAKHNTTVRFELYPKRGFADAPVGSQTVEGGAVFTFADGSLGLWTSFDTSVGTHGRFAVQDLRAGEEHWAVIGWNMLPEKWSIGRAAEMFAEVLDCWSDWSASLRIDHGGTRAPMLMRSALTVQLLSHADRDSAVAALTTSLPERIGGDRNYDYRYAWVRDASLSLALLARMGKTAEVKRYLHWLCSLTSATESPLQVCYRLDGNPNLDQEELPDVQGYRDSQPVLVGNRAAKQMQLGSMGFFADCARIYLDHGGEWREEFWHLVKRG